MNILIDIGHPAHVHYAKKSIEYWNLKGYTVIVIARNKKVIINLLKSYNIPFIKRSKGRKTLLGKFINLFNANWIILKASFKYNPNIYLSFSSPYAAQVAWILGKPHIAFNDTEHTDKVHKIITFPFSKAILTPLSYQNNLGHKQIRFNSINEGLYLHSNFFKPNTNIKNELNLKLNEKYVLLRFISWNAYHDMGQSGLTLNIKRQIIAILKQKYKIFISSEGKLPKEFKKYELIISPEKIHDVISSSSLFIGESGTMASESAYLGIPSIYINSLPLMCYLKVEMKFGLLKHFTNSDGVIDYIKKIIKVDNYKYQFSVNSKKMTDTFINPTLFLSWFIENYPKSFFIMKKNPDYQNEFK